MIIGKEGEQPFKISADGVSRRHAELTTDDKGVMTLRDLGSTNHTFVRDDKTGLFVRIENAPVTEMTFVCLGPDNSHGCSFYIKQLITPGFYNEELSYMNAKEDYYDSLAEKQTRKGKMITMALRIIPTILVIVLLFFVLPMIWEGIDGQVMTVVRIAVTMSIPVLMPLFYDPSKALKRIEQERERFHHCPNPACSRHMPSKEIRNMDCAACHLKTT